MCIYYIYIYIYIYICVCVCVCVCVCSGVGAVISYKYYQSTKYWPTRRALSDNTAQIRAIKCPIVVAIGRESIQETTDYLVVDQ